MTDETIVAPDEDTKIALPSMAQRIMDLPIGGCFSIAERYDGDTTTKETIQRSRSRLRNLLAPAVHRAKQRTGHEYAVEGGEITTRTLDILIVMVVTRTA